MDRNFKILIAGVFLLAFAVYVDDYFFRYSAAEKKKIKEEAILIQEGGVFKSLAGGDLLQNQKFDGAFLSAKNSDIVPSKAAAYSAVSAQDDNVLEAKGIYVFDLTKNKEVFLKNSETRFPLASLTKLMTAVAALENMAENSIITISENAIKQEGDSGFITGEKWSLSDLIDVMFVASLNDAAYAILEAVEKNLNDNGVEENFTPRKEFIGLMNAKAKNLKMSQTAFYNATGLDINGVKSGAYGSPKDIAVLIKYILEKHPRILLKTKEKLIIANPLNGKPRVFYNTNNLIGKISGIEGGKTGFTELSGGNLVLVRNGGENHKYLIIILGSSFYGRFTDAEKIIKMLVIRNF